MKDWGNLGQAIYQATEGRREVERGLFLAPGGKAGVVSSCKFYGKWEFVYIRVYIV